ncbi:MAG TPA: GNAT family N-acetyltransferase [Paraburkholderia sp.]|jgi:phosphinothricin acetyltransferase
MRLVHCCEAAHADAILEIFNDAIEHSTAIYEYHPRDRAFMTSWWAAKEKGHFPVLGLENDEGVLMAFASYGTFRAYPAFKYSVEHSIYVQKDYRGRRLAPLLMRALIDEATKRDVHVMIGAIDAENQASLSLHKRLGFQPAGVIREAGFKFGRWLDLAFYQLLLATPSTPVDG